MIKQVAIALGLLAGIGYTHAGASDNADPPEYSPQILIVENDEEAARLESEGVLLWRRRADMALALVPLDGRDKARAATPRYRRRAFPTLDKAKTYYDATRIHTGEGLPRPYLGRGVVVGFNDCGFYPRHANFLDADGESRVRRLSHYDASRAVRTLLDTPEEIAGWVTDDPDETHATHVAGILTGSYDANGMSGIAPEADIVATTSVFSDVDILMGCEDIVDYARQTGRPAVINLSLGSYNGPHDGTSLFCRYLDLIGEEAIVCLSSGNEASATNSFRHTFSDAERSIRMRVHSSDWTQFDMYGMTDAWSADGRPVGVRFMVYDEASREAVYSSGVYSSADGYDVTFDSADDPELARYLSGTLRLHGYVSGLNGRWVTEVEYDTHTEIPSPTSPEGTWARYNIALEFSAEPGVHVDVTSDAQYSRLASWPGYKGPDASLSVSDIATGQNVICVGMYTNRVTVPSLAGEDRTFGGDTPGTVNRRSSYGTLLDGRVLPHVVAPGGWLISSTSGAFAEAHPERVPDFCDSRQEGDETYYWDVNCGTSMSCPYVAGAIATWLEAVPTLTVDDVKETLAATNAHDYPDTSNPRHGQGWLRPYEGLLHVLDSYGTVAGVGVPADARAVIRGRTAEILNPGGLPLRVEIFAVDGGAAMPAVETDAAVSTIDLGALLPGVYVMMLADGSRRPVTLRFRK